MSTLLEKIETALRPHVGPENAISGPELARKVGLDERTLRDLISQSDVFQPCAKAGTGFFWPTDIEQIHSHDEGLVKQETAIRRRRKLFRAFWHKQGIAFPK